MTDKIDKTDKNEKNDYLLLVDNPFQLETNPKKLVQKLEVQEKKEKISEMTIPERLYSKTKISKKFGLIRALEEESERRSKKREEETLQEAKKKQEEKKKSKSMTICDYFLKRKYSNNLIRDSQDNDIRKQMSRINNILKEKRETIAEFIQKKREICLSNMNIYNKKEETERLEDFIKNEKESLKARKFYFENDWTMVNQFIKEVEGDANDAQKKAEIQQKDKEKNKDKWNQLQGDVERIEQKISRKEEEYKNLLTYKQFVDKISVNFVNNNSICIIWEKYQEMYTSSSGYVEEKKMQKNQQSDGQKDDFYLTQPNQSQNGQVQPIEDINYKKQSIYNIPFTASQLKDILNHIQEKNLYYCENNNQSEEEYENKKKAKENLEKTLEQKKNENRERIRELEKQREVANRRKQNLISLKIFNVSKVQISEGEDLDMQKIGEKIFSIVKNIEEYENKTTKGGIDTFQSAELINSMINQNIDTKEMRQQMHIIEKKLESITKFRESYFNDSEENQKRVAEIEKQIKLAKSREKQSELQQITVKNLDQRLKERESNLQNRRKGRTIMERSKIQKNVVKKVEITEDDQDNDEKYLREDFDFGNDVLKQEKKLQKINSISTQSQNDKKNH